MLVVCVSLDSSDQSTLSLCPPRPLLPLFAPFCPFCPFLPNVTREYYARDMSNISALLATLAAILFTFGVHSHAAPQFPGVVMGGHTNTSRAILDGHGAAALARLDDLAAVYPADRYILRARLRVLEECCELGRVSTIVRENPIDYPKHDLAETLDAQMEYANILTVSADRGGESAKKLQGILGTQATTLLTTIDELRRAGRCTYSFRLALIAYKEYLKEHRWLKAIEEIDRMEEIDRLATGTKIPGTCYAKLMKKLRTRRALLEEYGPLDGVHQ